MTTTPSRHRAAVSDNVNVSDTRMQDTEQASDDTENVVAAAGVAVSPGCDGLRLLLVDDDTAAVNALATLLRLEGAQVWAANSGEQALAFAAKHPLDIVLTDLGMPGMDGYAFLERVRQLPAMAAVPVVALTGFGRKDDARRTAAAGFAAHIGKPVQIDTLRNLIEQLVCSRHASPDPTSTHTRLTHRD